MRFEVTEMTPWAMEEWLTVMAMPANARSEGMQDGGVVLGEESWEAGVQC